MSNQTVFPALVKLNQRAVVILTNSWGNDWQKSKDFKTCIGNYQSI